MTFWATTHFWMHQLLWNQNRSSRFLSADQLTDEYLVKCIFISVCIFMFRCLSNWCKRSILLMRFRLLRDIFNLSRKCIAMSLSSEDSSMNAIMCCAVAKMLRIRRIWWVCSALSNWSMHKASIQYKCCSSSDWKLCRTKCRESVIEI